jgi:NAD(P)-dependent dehydrogenase (short-subunit alcohol dehydrogenase family)
MSDAAAPSPAPAPAAASGKVAMVTGTNSGVGLSLVVQLATAGYAVWATMRSLGKADDLVAALTAAGVRDRVTVDECDVASDESVVASVGRLLEAHGGRVDVLVNNAGYSVFGSVEFLDMATMKAQFETNFFGVIRAQQAVLPAMRAQGSGKIINITSVGGIWGQPFNDVCVRSTSLGAGAVGRRGRSSWLVLRL